MSAASLPDRAVGTVQEEEVVKESVVFDDATVQKAMATGVAWVGLPSAAIPVLAGSSRDQRPVL